MISIAPTQSNALSALRSFLLNVLPSGVEVIAAIANRVPEPKSSTFVLMTATRYQRIETNIDSSNDVRYTGSIAANVMTVTNVNFGVIEAGAAVFGVGVDTATTIVNQTGGTPGGIGTYTVSVPQSISIRVLASGSNLIQLNSQMTVQLDFHSVDNSAADLANTVSAALRDPYGVNFFAGLTPPLNGIAPLYADDPRQMPFINENNQAEWRWILEANFQINQVISVPQQYADSIEVTLVELP